MRSSGAAWKPFLKLLRLAAFMLLLYSLALEMLPKILLPLPQRKTFVFLQPRSPNTNTQDGYIQKAQSSLSSNFLRQFDATKKWKIFLLLVRSANFIQNQKKKRSSLLKKVQSYYYGTAKALERNMQNHQDLQHQATCTHTSLSLSLQHWDGQI